jgi:hypothetical protein
LAVDPGGKFPESTEAGTQPRTEIPHRDDQTQAAVEWGAWDPHPGIIPILSPNSLLTLQLGCCTKYRIKKVWYIDTVES